MLAAPNPVRSLLRSSFVSGAGGGGAQGAREQPCASLEYFRDVDYENCGGLHFSDGQWA